MVWLEVKAPRRAARIDDGALRTRGAPSILERFVPAPGIPGPIYALRRQGIADGLAGLYRQRTAILIVALGVREVEIAFLRGRNAARLIGRLGRIDGKTIRRDLAAISVD